MKSRLKVMTVVGTRPEIIRLSRVMAALDNSDAIEHIIVHTGQNYDYELNQIFFDDMLNSFHIYKAQSLYSTLIYPMSSLRSSSHQWSWVSLKSHIQHMLGGMININNR